MKISLMDLRKQYEEVRGEVEPAVKEIFESQNFILGKYGSDLEEHIAAYCGVPYAIGMNSGTDALFLALRALDIKKGDEVITTPFTFIATVEAIINTGARPVFADIDKESYNIDPEKIKRRITKRTKAIMPVHLFGQCAAMEAIMAVARKYGLKVIEDTAQAIGATRNGHKAGSFGTMGAISFYPGKNLGGAGDGGMVVTSNKRLAERLFLLRNHGSTKKAKYTNVLIGVNSRLDNIQAAVLDIKLKRLDSWLDKRIMNAGFFSNELEGLPLVTPVTATGNKHTFHLYMIATEKRDALAEHLAVKGVDARVYYPIPMHLQPALKFLGYKKGDFPCVEEVAGKLLAIPVHEGLTDEEKTYIVEAIKEFF
ncbi:MAG: DegT/DnrJ/EryC1/StrS family aminotransferase [Candidatus Omnitrophica bacterium]|nr:DegT/DnrJ/EryC1/StrS family aminotransferase [Candidatus Omnitrophota bacterium]